MNSRLDLGDSDSISKLQKWRAKSGGLCEPASEKSFHEPLNVQKARLTRTQQNPNINLLAIYRLLFSC